MMYRCATQFELEDEDLALKKEYLTSGEIELDYEEKSAPLQEIDPISDSEEMTHKPPKSKSHLLLRILVRI
jgi:hypothetical protein